jgi:ABC-2 type transport system ATP-binding protein
MVPCGGGGREGGRGGRAAEVLELQGLSRRYGDVVALRIVLGVLEPDRGEVRWRGRPVDAETRRRVGYMPEDQGQTFLQ